MREPYLLQRNVLFLLNLFQLPSSVSFSLADMQKLKTKYRLSLFLVNASLSFSSFLASYWIYCCELLDFNTGFSQEVRWFLLIVCNHNIAVILVIQGPPKVSWIAFTSKFRLSLTIYKFNFNRYPRKITSIDGCVWVFRRFNYMAVPSPPIILPVNWATRNAIVIRSLYFPKQLTIEGLDFLVLNSYERNKCSFDWSSNMYLPQHKLTRRILD